MPKLFLLFLGILLTILVVAAIWDRRIKAPTAAIVVSLGVGLIAMALWDGFASAIGALDGGVRIRIFSVIASLSTLVLSIFAFFRTGLHPRYGLLWVVISLLVLLMALFPGPLRSFPSILGLGQGSAIAALSIVFLLLLVFHLTIVISEVSEHQHNLMARLEVLEKKLFDTLPETGGERFDRKRKLLDTWREKFLHFHPWKSPGDVMRYGTAVTAPVIIVVAVCAVFLVGMAAPQPMIGDEVTHYYMMKTQADTFPTPNFNARIPNGFSKVEVRRYPHSFLWHYIGACIYLVTGGAFLATQLYQVLFLGQMLLVAYLLARSRGGVENRAALVYLLVLASMPMTAIFSVAFYQDIPLTAQILTAFYFLRKGRWLLATFFLCLGLGIKVTAILFFPAFFVCLLVWTYRRQTVLRACAATCCSLVLTAAFTLGLGKTIESYAHATFYPVVQVERIIEQVQHRLRPPAPDTKPDQSKSGEPKPAVNKNQVVSERVAEIIANHPGDLRNITNFFVYGGLILYLTVGCAVAAAAYQFLNRDLRLKQKLLLRESSLWLWGVGLSYIVFAAWFLRTAPDARFFLPGLVFCLLPVAERVISLPKSRILVILIAALALMQSGYALAMTYKLRVVSPEIIEAIEFLEDNQPIPRTVFMYPEGNYRLFPVDHEWYLGYFLRDFWRADNDKRIAILNCHRIGAIVIKKHLVAPVDKQITNLGVYPTYFVRQIDKDPRFPKVFENKGVVIYEVPQVHQRCSDFKYW